MELNLGVKSRRCLHDERESQKGTCGLEGHVKNLNLILKAVVICFMVESIWYRV